MKVLVLATRDPGGPQTGRKSVIRTILDSLLALGHEVELVVLARRPPELAADPSAVVRVQHLAPPSAARIFWSVATQATRRRRSLNECLYESPALARRVAQLAAERGCDVVVADMIRTAELAFATGLPVVLDLDDLLSKRYAQQGGSAGRPAASVLGYHQENLPRPLVGIGSGLASRALGVESALLRTRELTCARRAAIVSLVSEAEREPFEVAAGRPVVCLPMAVDVLDEPAPVADNPPRLLFTGKLDYGPNVEALRWYASEVVPHLERSGLRLEVIGRCPDEVRAELAGPSVEFLGYVDDLWATLRTGRAFLAPIVSGTGVKTKVLEGLAAGLPVIATPAGVEGIPVTASTDCFVATSGAEFAAHVRTVAADPGLAATVGLAGRELVRVHYSRAFGRPLWERALAGVQGLVTA
jgi:glycosyltransferase involved in cell wall biosynthesis